MLYTQAAYVGILELLGVVELARELGDHARVVFLLLGDFAKIARPFHVLDGRRQQPIHQRFAQSLHDNRVAYHLASSQLW